MVTMGQVPKSRKSATRPKQDEQDSLQRARRQFQEMVQNYAILQSKLRNEGYTLSQAGEEAQLHIQQQREKVTIEKLEWDDY